MASMTGPTFFESTPSGHKKGGAALDHHRQEAEDHAPRLARLLEASAAGQRLR
jgi:hypothetical protein